MASVGRPRTDMRPSERIDAGERRRRNARLLARALGDGRVWSELPAKRKLGMVLFILGTIALPFSFLPIEPGGWFWGVSGLLAMIVGGALAFSGVDNPGPPWPPYGPG